MKERSLLHLMLASASASAPFVDADGKARLETAATSLEVDRPGRGELRLRWTDTNGPHEHTIESKRFTFARRGDVPKLVDRRPEQLDDRTQNWRTAIRLWAEVLGLDDLERAVDDVPRTVNGPRVIDQPSRLQPVAFVACALVAAIVGRWVVDGAASTVLLTVACLLGVSLLAPGQRDDRLLAVVRGVAAGAIAVSVLGVPLLGLVAAAIMIVADVAVLGFRAERRRLTLLLGGVAAAAIGAAVITAIDGSITSASGGSSAASAAVTTIAIVGLVGLGILDFFHGVRDRLSAWLFPVGVAFAALGSVGSVATAIGTLVVLAVLLAARIARRPRHVAVTPPAAAVGTPVQLSAGRQSTKV